MKIISLNIECNKHDELVLPFLKKENPDVVCVQELLEDKFEFYKKELSMYGVFRSASYIDTVVHKDLAGKKEGVAIFTKNSIADSGNFFLAGGEDNVSMPFSEYLERFNNFLKIHGSYEDFEESRVLVWADVKNTEGVVFRFLTAHLPVTTQGRVTPYQLGITDNLLVKLGELGEFVLCGDFNSPRGCESFARFANKYKDNIPLEYKTSIDQNLHRVKGIQFMVDGLFTTPTYQASSVRLVDGVSDHMAIVADINKN